MSVFNSGSILSCVVQSQQWRSAFDTPSPFALGGDESNAMTAWPCALGSRVPGTDLPMSARKIALSTIRSSQIHFQELLKNVKEYVAATSSLVRHRGISEMICNVPPHLWQISDASSGVGPSAFFGSAAGAVAPSRWRQCASCSLRSRWDSNPKLRMRTNPFGRSTVGLLIQPAMKRRPSIGSVDWSGDQPTAGGSQK